MRFVHSRGVEHALHRAFESGRTEEDIARNAAIGTFGDTRWRENKR